MLRLVIVSPSLRTKKAIKGVSKPSAMLSGISTDWKLSYVTVSVAKGVLVMVGVMLGVNVGCGVEVIVAVWVLVGDMVAVGISVGDSVIVGIVVEVGATVLVGVRVGIVCSALKLQAENNSNMQLRKYGRICLIICVNLFVLMCQNRGDNTIILSKIS